MFPKHIRKLQEILGVPDEAVIQVRVSEGDPRVCDYCNTLLIDEKGEAIEKIHLTDYGLMCDKCVKDIQPRITYEKGANVSNEEWYQSGIER